MYIEQILKDEKTSLNNLFFYSQQFYLAQSNRLYLRLFNTYQYFLNQLSLILKHEVNVNNETEYQSNYNATEDIIRFEISKEKMKELLALRQICASDIHCLDTSSKQCLKALCLKTCLHNKVTDNSPETQLTLDELNLTGSTLPIEKYDVDLYLLKRRCK